MTVIKATFLVSLTAVLVLVLGCESTNSAPPAKPKAEAVAAPLFLKESLATAAPTPTERVSGQIPLENQTAMEAIGTKPSVLPATSVEAQPPPPPKDWPLEAIASAPVAPAPVLPQTATANPVMAISGSAVPEVSPEKSVGAWLIVAGGLGLILLAAYVRYRFSETAKIRGKVGALQAELEQTLAARQATIGELQAAARTAADAYISAARNRYLAAVSLDDIRKLAPGARMQPLRDFGIRSLLDCKGWSAGHFMALKGIGEDSGSRLAAACAALTESVNRQAIPHPEVPGQDAEGRQLYQKVCHQRQSQEALKVPGTALQAIGDVVLPRCLAVRSATTFAAWIIRSEKKEPLRAALDEGLALQGDEATRSALESAKTSLADVRAGRHVSDADLTADVCEHQEIYRQAFDRLLGPGAGGRKPAFAAPQPPVLPATEPISLPMQRGDSVSYPIGNSGIRIEIGFETQQSATTTGVAAHFWTGPGESTIVQGFRIDGPLYVGRGLGSVRGGSIEPALIDPQLKVDSSGADCHVRMLTYWSNYSQATPSARGSYLQWLAGGKSDPQADVGYVFLYFYGLERRALADSSAAARSDIPAIIAEVERLRAIYGSNRSFDRYSAEFLSYLMATRAGEVAPPDEPPALVRYNLPYDLRFRLGQFAAAQLPLPPNWAHAWHYCDPRTRLPASAERCPDFARQLFEKNYREQFGEGLILPSSRTRLKITYKPASASFGGPLVQAVDLPDVSVMTSSYTKLDALAAECFRQLDPYSRYIWRNRDQAESLEARLLLPLALWPDTLQASLRQRAALAGKNGEVQAICLRELMGSFQCEGRPTKAQYLALTRALGSSGIGLEPDLRFTKEIPELHDPVAVFPVTATESLGAGFGVASLIVQFAAAVASADGEFSDAEARKLGHEIVRTPGLELAGQQRIMARIAIYRIKAPSINGLRATIERMDRETRLRVTDVLLGVISGEGVIQPAEVKMMEKIYTLLGLDTATLYPRLHGLEATPDAAIVPAAVQKGPLRLDPAKIARLKASSDEVTKKLAAIFVEEPVVAEVIAEEPPEPAAETNRFDLPQLDAAHGELLMIILGRAEWTRAEFEEVCADKGLMPDGAIERINEASFTRFDEPVIEGDDPLEISVQLFKETTV